MQEAFFYLFAALTLIPAIMLVCSRKPVNSAMLFIASLFGTATLFALLGAYLLSVLQILVYVGTGIILFLFIIMLMGAGKGGKLSQGEVRKALIGLAFFVLLAGCPISVILSGIGGTAPAGEASVPASTATNFGLLLFTKYQLPFEIVGFLLLAAMVGVIHVSRPATDAAKSNEEAVEGK
jgi:NADH-quinone oxidoreductase subunit J